MKNSLKHFFLETWSDGYKIATIFTCSLALQYFGASKMPMSLYIPATGIFLLSGARLLTLLHAWHVKTAHMKATSRALKDLDEVINGLRYLGAEADVIETKRVDDPSMPGPLIFEQLCKTKKGRWFLLQFEVRFNTSFARRRQVFPLTQEQADQWLAKLVEVPAGNEQFETA